MQIYAITVRTEFKEDDIFRTNVPLISNINSVGLNVNLNVGLNVMQNKILKLIANNKNITQKEISVELNTTKRTIERNMMILKEMDLILLTQNAMAELFDTTKQNISLHIKNIFKENKLNENSVVKENLPIASDGKNYKTKL